MRILITNCTLADRAGTECYVRDLAIELLRRGHQPIAFSTNLGAVAEELRAASVPVVDDLSNLTEQPDVIHGHHHLPTMIALLRFPNTPAVNFCHGFVPWPEHPLKHPNIVRYVAVDDACLDRLIVEHGIPREKTEVILNFVNLNRFKKRTRPLPEHATRALVFSNYANESSLIPNARRACDALGLSLDVVGKHNGTDVPNPEDLLQNYDVVFAKAKSAMEAMAVGCAVVLCDYAGVGPLVSSNNFEELRRLNFGLRALLSPHDPAVFEEQLRLYDRFEAEAVCNKIRACADLDSTVDTLLNLYASVITQFQTEARSPERASQAVSDYIGWLSTRFGATHANQVELAVLQSAFRTHESNMMHVQSENEVLREQADDLRSRNERLIAEVEQLHSTITEKSAEIEQLQEELRQASWRHPRNYVLRINRLIKRSVLRKP